MFKVKVGQDLEQSGLVKDVPVHSGPVGLDGPQKVPSNLNHSVTVQQGDGEAAS